MTTFKQLSRRIRQLFTRGLIHIVDTQTLLQTMQVELLSDEILDGVEHLENYGFTSCPKPGAEVVAASVGGHRSHTVIISAFDRRFRLKGLAEGEVAIYTDEGDKIHLKRNGSIDISASGRVDVIAPEVVVLASTSVTLTAPIVNISGDASIGGDLSVSGAVGAAAAGIGGIDFATHTHGGVTNGTGNTGIAQ